MLVREKAQSIPRCCRDTATEIALGRSQQAPNQWRKQDFCKRPNPLWCPNRMPNNPPTHRGRVAKHRVGWNCPGMQYPTQFHRAAQRATTGYCSQTETPLGPIKTRQNAPHHNQFKRPSRGKERVWVWGCSTGRGAVLGGRCVCMCVLLFVCADVERFQRVDR